MTILETMLLVVAGVMVLFGLIVIWILLGICGYMGWFP